MNWLRKWLIGEDYIRFQESERESIQAQLQAYDQMLGRQDKAILALAADLNNLRNQAAFQPAPVAQTPQRRVVRFSEFKAAAEAQPREHRS
jgi:hypothetical protein